jgi:alpha-ketoglutarate-dependent dioxygenase alkB family protein 2
LGNSFAKFKDRYFAGGLHVEKTGAEHRAVRWRVRQDGNSDPDKAVCEDDRQSESCAQDSPDSLKRCKGLKRHVLENKGGNMQTHNSPGTGLEESLAYLNDHDAYVEYYPGFLSRAEAEYYWNALFDQLEFNPEEESKVRLPFSSEKIAIPRRQTAYGDSGTTYTFSGCVVPARIWIPILVELRELLQVRTGYSPNFVLVNHYRSGSDYIGWHSDDERDLGDAPDILSLSLGAERDFQFRHRDAFPRAKRPALRPDLKTVTIPLRSGSLLIMRHPTNQNWKHRLPKRGGKQAKEVGERLNLTWRTIFV